MRFGNVEFLKRRDCFLFFLEKLGYRFSFNGNMWLIILDWKIIYLFKFMRG